ncbi:MAG: YggT family protein [Clostridia bacterium]|nr:YggT family protein [Clostridia bacterium]
MEIILYILAKAVAIYLSLASYAMLGRVLLGFFVNPEESRLYALLLLVSEPVVLPFRLVMAKFNIGQNSILDMPFMAAYLGLSLAQLFLPII